MEQHRIGRWERGVIRFVHALALACAGLVVLGSFAHGTRRVWVEGGSISTWEEGAARWAGWTFLGGLVALGLLVLAGFLARWGAGAAALAVLPLWFAAERAGSHWHRLLDERERDRDYALSIAAGLPVVTVAGAVGAVLALLLALGLARRIGWPDPAS